MPINGHTQNMLAIGKFEDPCSLDLIWVTGCIENGKIEATFFDNS